MEFTICSDIVKITNCKISNKTCPKWAEEGGKIWKYLEWKI